MVQANDDAVLVEHFRAAVRDNPMTQTAILAMETLIKSIEMDDSSATLLSLDKRLKNVQETIYSLPEMKDKMSVKSGTELLVKFTTRMAIDIIQEESDFDKVKKSLIQRGNECIERMRSCQHRAADECRKFIPDGATILTHGHTLAACHVILNACKQGKLKRLYVTEMTSDQTTRLKNERSKLIDELKSRGVETVHILSRAAAYVMERVDVVICGAEAVVESGAVVSQLGTYSMAIAAHVHKKPFYIVCESFKFMRSYPLKQVDVDQQHKYRETSDHPCADLTPAKFVTLLVTDLGSLTPPAVSHHLIKLYT